MSSPAERYAAARRRAADGRTELGKFAAGYDFGLDPFQLEACRALESGHGVLVAAPTGSGKTVVGEFAVHLAVAKGQKCFYTTPIKALSNQKYGDLIDRYGESQVGLLTGDNSINGDAPVVVMTTEVLRNMLYAQSDTLRGLSYVVMDEVHYLADRFRGAVWEEVIIHLPEEVRLVSLSATVSNAEEFGEWLVSVRGNTQVVVEEHRPVPLWQHVLLGNRLLDLFVDAEHKEVNPALVRVAREQAQWSPDPRDRRSHRGGTRQRFTRVPSRVDVIEDLDREGLLPAITFIFSRAGCDAAVHQCLRAGMRLNTAEEAAEVRRVVEERTAELPEEDLGVLGYHDWAEGLARGIAAHHAGMLPTFKQVTEDLFADGYVKAVFATETLALGVNMPARSVVLEKLTKWNGETHADVTAGEYTQLTGRAGRRGIDVEGHAVVLWQPGMDPAALAGLASTRTYPLRSSFRPSYNMAVNLVGWVGRDKARGLLEQSFAQFQSDAAVVGLARQVRRNEDALAGYAEQMRCHLGDFDEYAGLRRALSDREAKLAREGAASRKAEASDSLERLRPGDVIKVPAGRRAGLAVVIDPGLGNDADGPRPLVLTVDRQVKRLSIVDFPAPVEPIDRVRIPKSFNARSPQSRRDLASSLRSKVPDTGAPGRPQKRAGRGDDAEITRLRAAIRSHACHGCAEREDHARWAERWHRLRRDTDALEQRVRNRTGTISRTFDRVCALLDQLGYLDGDTVTAPGKRLARVYGELDLLTAEAVTAGLFTGLTAAELAACVSALVYEGRERDEASPRLPGGGARRVLAELTRLWGELEQLEQEHRLDFLRQPDVGFSWVTWRWASGHPLEAVLTDSGMSAGDFVRWTKQVIDALDQLSKVGDEGSDLRRTAIRAVESLRRGVIAYSSI
ncbi:MAG: ATP-dependent helicase HelY [Frankiales bacterium]|nr:ATP-dependent helicase HelY [Frankiales bacterium]